MYVLDLQKCKVASLIFIFVPVSVSISWRHRLNPVHSCDSCICYNRVKSKSESFDENTAYFTCNCTYGQLIQVFNLLTLHMNQSNLHELYTTPSIVYLQPFECKILKEIRFFLKSGICWTLDNVLTMPSCILLLIFCVSIIIQSILPSKAPPSLISL